MTIKIKICGLRHPENIQDVLALRPDYVGFIFHPSSKRFVGKLDATWVSQLAGVKKVGVFVDAGIDDVTNAVRSYNFQTVQLHGDESPAYCAALKNLGIPLIKAFGINEQFDWLTLSSYEDYVDYYLFDTKSPIYGGTGMQFDWTLLNGYKANKPFFLSGGIGAENIQEAWKLNDSRLYALDLNSKFEIEPGIKDIELLKRTLQTISDE